MDHPECYARLRALTRAGLPLTGSSCTGNSPSWRQEQWVSTEDAEARQEAVKFVDAHVPMALEAPDLKSPLQAENPVKPARKPRRTSEQVAADKAAAAAEKERKKAERKLEQERAREARAAKKLQDKLDEKAAKIAEAEEGTVVLPAVVMRSGLVRHVTDAEAWSVMQMYADDLFLDCETSGYPLGHALYELRTVQLGGEEAAVVFDASDPHQMDIAALALALARRVRAYSVTADFIPCVVAGLITWEAIWAKGYDVVLNSKLADPALSGSDADALKELSADLLGRYAVSPAAEKAKNELFRVMGCLTETGLTTPPEKNGWYRVNRYSVTMTRYAGSDVLDLAAVLRVLPPLPVSTEVLDRERAFQEACAPVTHTGFALDYGHIRMMIEKTEAAKAQAQQYVLILSDGKITNPKSPDVIKLIPEIFPGIELGVDRKTKRPSANKGSLEKLCLEHKDNPLAFHLFKQILEYRHCDTTLGLLLRPLELLCTQGDSRMRPTVYTIEASTGRTSCRRPNGQQFSRQGGVRACVKAGEMDIELVNGQWVMAA